MCSDVAETSSLKGTDRNEVAIRVCGVGKSYKIHDQPSDRLKEMLLGRLRTMVGMTPKRYSREFTALENVSFELCKGSTVGIVGRNGSGKSTLLQIAVSYTHLCNKFNKKMDRKAKIKLRLAEAPPTTNSPYVWKIPPTERKNQPTRL